MMPLLFLLRSRLRALLAPTRLWDWWEFKVPVFLGVAYVTAVAVHVPMRGLWPRLLVIVAAIVPVASYVCVINEITDRRDDARAGKPNSMIGRSRAFQAAWVVGCLSAGAIACWGLSALCGGTPAPWLYVANWICFTLYSVPPVRLKARGLYGVITDACGGQVLPTVWGAHAVASAMETPLPTPLLGGIAVWSFALGCRGILLHQLRDRAADQLAGVDTFAVVQGERETRHLIRFLVMPVEFAALLAVITQTGVWAAGAGLVLCLLWDGLDRYRSVPRSSAEATAGRDAGEAESFAIWYYPTLFPLAGILHLLGHSPQAGLLVPLHVVLFPGLWGISLDRLRRLGSVCRVS